MARLTERLAQMDRRWVFVLIAVGTIVPIIKPIGFPVSTTPPVRAYFQAIENMKPGQVLLVSFDYGPTTEPENGPMAAAVLRHAFSKGVPVVVIALFPIGGLAMATEELARVTPEFPNLVYGVDYVNLGYKEGGQATMRKMNESIHEAFPTDVNGTPVDQLPLMQRVQNYQQIGLISSFATGIIGEWWANLVYAQFGKPVAVGCTAVSAPKYYPYVDAGQMVGLMGGLKGASEYERLLLDKYPRNKAAYSDPTQYTAIKGMDVQTIDHTIIILFIIVGNIAYFASRAKRRV
jgi:hypothetical protein